jgi:hypothetical protein
MMFEADRQLLDRLRAFDRMAREAELAAARAAARDADFARLGARTDQLTLRAPAQRPRLPARDRFSLREVLRERRSARGRRRGSR